MSDLKNPKLIDSGIVDCIPQKGYCGNGCQECFFNNGFFADVDKELPIIPTDEEASTKIVRVNSGHDSNLQKELVLETTKNYKRKFYNTSIPLFDFPAPVMFTCNGRLRTMQDKQNGFILLPPEETKNLLAVRFRTSTWNVADLERCIDWYTGWNIPVIITFMRYKLYENVIDKDNYDFHKHIVNSYWCIKEEPFYKIKMKFAENPLVYVCGKNWGNSYCKGCGTCEMLYGILEKVLNSNTEVTENGF